ncbi:MAG TPA: glucose-6-phosphate dehydrogenase [Phototrophicaceae bacterium]|jgi:glucose-6-phosphate 1-dehydrogenase|nr:glucose-6-phosphate dehydrogenase [Phototrophicaceae bacterium]
MSAAAQQTSIVIFGASGDLTYRKLIPALYNNFAKGRLSGDFNIVGMSRTPLSHDDFRTKMREGCEKFAPTQFKADKWDEFATHIYYVPADAGDAESMGHAEAGLLEIEGSESANRLYYLSVAPNLYTVIIANLQKHEMQLENGGWRRVIIEKPFGTDLASAQELNKATHAVFDEHQVYRIDHYLGKETAQNILFMRFANAIFEPVWNRNYIDNVQINVAESVDVGHRASFYDSAGIMRDMFQNHLLQLLTLVAMEPPSSFEATALRNEKVKVLRSIRIPKMEDTFRAQYEGYRQADGVAANSQTATFAALKLSIDNWRWEGVPFYLRSGKALNSKESEIIIEFKCPPHVMLRLEDTSDFQPNIMSMCIQPDEGIHLQIQAKVPDHSAMMPVSMEFHYETSFKGQNIPEAYERLLLDALHGDAALFNRSDEIEAAWGIIDPVIQGWELDHDAPPLLFYPTNTEGPAEIHQFIAASGDVWRPGCVHDTPVKE